MVEENRAVNVTWRGGGPGSLDLPQEYLMYMRAGAASFRGGSNVRVRAC